MKAKLRIARATNDLKRVSRMYSDGLDLKTLASFYDHAGFDGVMLGADGVDYHFEFTQKHGEQAPRSASPELLVVFYAGDVDRAAHYKLKMQSAGFQLVRSHNPYWDQSGYTLEDFEGYRIVLCHRHWPSD